MLRLRLPQPLQTFQLYYKIQRSVGNAFWGFQQIYGPHNQSIERNIGGIPDQIFGFLTCSRKIHCYRLKFGSITYISGLLGTLTITVYILPYLG